MKYLNCPLIHIIFIVLTIYTFFIDFINAATIPSGLSPMRITVDDSEFHKSFVSQDQRDYIKKLMTLFKTFLSELLYVKPRTSVIKNGAQLFCRDTYIGSYGIRGFKNTDLVIVVSATNMLFDNFRVRYNFCSWDNRPIMMEARYQIRNFVKNPINYELSEMKRAFMYNGMWNKDNFGYWVDDSTGNTYTSTSLFYNKIRISGVDRYFLTGKHTKEAVQKHFGCSTAIGLEVESNTYMSNYIPDDLYNNEQIRDYSNRLFSQFDVSIIRDMGVYEYVNEDLAEEIVWGKNEGCSFLNNFCTSIYSETIEVDNILYQCTQFRNSKYIKPKTEVQSLLANGSCPRVTQTNSISCMDATQGNSFTAKVGEIYGSNSKCFESKVFTRAAIDDPNLIISFAYKNSPIRCHYVECVLDYINIVFALNQKVRCKIPDAIIQVDTQDFVGEIKCPSDFSLYCKKQFCVNDCNGKGFCNNGVCQCLSGNYGDDCSIECKPGQLNCQCLSPCAQCQTTNDKCTACVPGYKLTFGQNTCEQICDETCLTCSKPLDPNSCTTCDLGYVLIDGQCVPCISPCKRCINKANECTICIDNYKLNGKTCQPICDVSCKTCLLPYSNNTCLSCYKGYYLSEYGTCERCNYNCKECNGSDSYCTDCFDNYQLDIISFQCLPICAANCATCELPLNKFSCITCIKGYYIQGGRCLDCIDQANEYGNKVPDECKDIVKGDNCGVYCKYCLKNEPDSCVQCISGDTKGLPSCICQHEFYFINKKCTQCDKREYFDNSMSKCSPCHESCVQCFGSSEFQCKSCQQDGSQYLDPKTNQCICIDPSKSMIYNRQLGRYTCELGMTVLFYRYEETHFNPRYQQFQAKFTDILQSSSIDQQSIDHSFSFQISDTPADYYSIRVESIQSNFIVFSIINFQNFKADFLMITIKSTKYIKSMDGRYIQQSQLDTQQVLEIGPLFINDNKDDSVNNSLNKVLNFLSYNENVKNVITFFNQFSIFLYLLNTIQSSALLLLINTNFPSVLYEFERIFGIFIYKDVPDQAIIRSVKECSMSLLYTLDFCDEDAKDKVTQDKFERLGMSYSFPINTGKVLNQFIIFFILYMVCAYILAFRQVPINIAIISNQSDLQKKSKISEIAGTFYEKAYSLLVSTLEANILLISISAHLQLRQNIMNQNLLITRISYYCFALFMVFLILILVSAYKKIQKDQFNVLTLDLKTNGIFFCRNFHYLNFFKKWIVCAAHVEFYYYPSTLIEFVIGVYSFFLLLTIIFRPFQSMVSNVQRIIGDSLFIFIYVCVLQIHTINLQIQKDNKISNDLLNKFNFWGLITCYCLLSYNMLYLILFVFNLITKIIPICRKKSKIIRFINPFSLQLVARQSDKKEYKNNDQSFRFKDFIDHNIYTPLEQSINNLNRDDDKKNQKSTWPTGNNQTVQNISLSNIQYSQQSYFQAADSLENQNQSKKQVKQEVIKLTQDFQYLKNNNKKNKNLSTFGFPLNQNIGSTSYL